MLRVVFQDVPSRNRFEQFPDHNPFFSHLLLRVSSNPNVVTECLALYVSEDRRRGH